MSAALRIIAVSLLFAGLLLSRVASAAPQEAIDEMRVLVRSAYVAGGWSERDAEVIAEVKVQRMVARNYDGDLDGFEALDPPGYLCSGSSGLAAAEWLLTTKHDWNHAQAASTVWTLYSALSGWLPPGADEGIPGGASVREGCTAYSVTYVFCRGGQRIERTAFWHSPCVSQNFVQNPCVGVPQIAPCPCDEGEECGIEYAPIGACGGVPAGGCVRIINMRRMPTAIDCAMIAAHNNGGCGSCLPPVPIDADCPQVPIVAVLCFPDNDGPCGGCVDD